MRGERVARVRRRGVGRRAVQCLAIANRREIVHRFGRSAAFSGGWAWCFACLALDGWFSARVLFFVKTYTVLCHKVCVAVVVVVSGKPCWFMEGSVASARVCLTNQ